jgi:thioredoxin reductase (NADPH)
VHDIVVVGAGLAGLTAALYAARSGLDTLLVDEMGPGGQLLNAGTVDTGPGMPADTTGPDLVGRLIEQALERGVEMTFGRVVHLEPRTNEFALQLDGDEPLRARAAIIASGSRPRALGVPGENEFAGHGVSNCAVCDGALFRSLDVAVVGAGDAAYQSALHLSGTARTVRLLRRHQSSRAVAELVRRVDHAPDVSVVNDVEVTAIHGTSVVESVTLRGPDGESTLAISGLFVNVGTQPNSEPFADLLKLDGCGRICVDLSLATSVAGIFAAGAIRSGTPDQLGTAVGDGVTAALSAARYLKGEQS